MRIGLRKSWRRSGLVLLGVALALGVWAAMPVSPSSAQGELSVTSVKAPVAPDGVTAGAHPDFVLTFMDRDPTIEGIRLLVGGTVSVELPAGFVNEGVLPVTGIGTTDCGPPGNPFLCSTGVLLQGWPQSLELPFPAVSWDADTNTLTVTSTVDWSAIEGPGVKQVHLLLFGFTNPVAGSYSVRVTVQPDPADPATLSGTGEVEILAATVASLNPMSIINPGPPPPFPNPIYQTVGLGEAPLLWGFYVWDADGNGVVGADIVRRTSNHYWLVDAAGDAIGQVWIDAPAGADAMNLEAVTPATDVGAFVTGIPTALLTAQFTPDPAVAGTYVAFWQIYGGAALDLTPGFNEIVYGGPGGPVAAMLASIAGDYSVVWHWDNLTQAWTFYSPTARSISLLKTLTSGDIYWIGATGATSLATGALTRMFVTVEG